MVATYVLIDGFWEWKWGMVRALYWEYYLLCFALLQEAPETHLFPNEAQSLMT